MHARGWIDWLSPFLSVEGALDARVVVSELVTNAVLHAGLITGDPIHVSARVHHDRIALVVCDCGRGIPLFDAAPAASQAIGGRGLFIVQRLATRLLIDGPRGKVVVELGRAPLET